MIFKKKTKDERLPSENFRNTWLEIKINKANYFLVAPYMLIFLTFTVIPVLSSMVLSFTYFNLLEFPESQPLKRRENAQFSAWFETLWKELNA